MSSTPSSRRRGRPSRSSQSSTPQPQATPRQTLNGAAVASSSPLFFQSSPIRSTHAPPSQLASDGLTISSPPRNSSNAGDREATPRQTARVAAGLRDHQIAWLGSNATQNPPPSDTIPARVPYATPMASNQIYQAPAVVFSSTRIDHHGYLLDEVTSIQIHLHLLRPNADASM